MDGVDVVSRQQLAKVVVSLAITVLVVLVGSLLGGLTDAFSDVGNGDVLHIGTTKKGPLIGGAHVANADAAHDDAVASGRDIALPEGLRRNHIRCRGDCGGGLQELAARRLAATHRLNP